MCPEDLHMNPENERKLSYRRIMLAKKTNWMDVKHLKAS